MTEVYNVAEIDQNDLTNSLTNDNTLFYEKSAAQNYLAQRIDEIRNEVAYDEDEIIETDISSDYLYANFVTRRNNGYHLILQKLNIN